MDNKIKIRVTEDILNKIMNDAELFEYFKTDGTVNRNAFLHDLICKYFYEFKKENEILLKRICSVLDNNMVNDNPELANEILKTIIVNGKSKDKKKVINYTANSQVLSLLEGLVDNDELYSVATSSYLCVMFQSYFEKPRYDRERIIFSETFAKLNKAIKEKRIISISSKNSKDKTFELMPYKIIPSKDEKCNYLHGYNITEKKPSSFRVSRITGLYIKEEKFNMDKSIYEDIKDDIAGNPSTAEKKEVVVVRFTEEGVRKYNMITNLRPKLKERDSNRNYYTFEAPLFQVEEYLKRFGKDAYVIKPKKLCLRLKEFYSEAHQTYVGEDDDSKK